MPEHKMVVVVVRSLRLGPGKIAAQVGHAAVGCALSAQKHDPKRFQRWLDDGQGKIVVRVEAEKELYPLNQAAQDAGLTTYLVTDAGHTQVPPGTVTCLGIGPAPEADLDRITGHLPLL